MSVGSNDVFVFKSHVQPKFTLTLHFDNNGKRADEFRKTELRKEIINIPTHTDIYIFIFFIYLFMLKHKHYCKK